MAIGAFLDIICEEFNRVAIPQLIDLNGEHFNAIKGILPALRKVLVLYDFLITEKLIN